MVARPNERGGDDGLEGSRVVVFTRPGCSYCTKAKTLLGSRGIPFGLVDLFVEPERREEARQLSGGAGTVPQIFIGSRRVGGFDDLKALDDSGGLQDAVAMADGPITTRTCPTKMSMTKSSVMEQSDMWRALRERATEMAKLEYQAGSRPSMLDFVRYACTRKPNQDQTNNVVLNLAASPQLAKPEPVLATASADELASMLRQAMLQLLDEFVDPATGDVDYLRMKTSESWHVFRALAAEFGNERLASELRLMSEPSRKAFFINLYNAMTFHGIVSYGRRKGSWYLYCFFIAPAVSYRLAGVQMSLDDIEHGVLRAKADYFQKPEQEFQRSIRMSQTDARIHMALNCGAKGCPPVGVYTGATLDADLDDAVIAFLADEQNLRIGQVAVGQMKVEITALVQFYFEDFAGQGSKSHAAALRWFLPYVTGDKKECLLQALKMEDALKLSYIPYNWDTNGTNMPLDPYIYKAKL